jgi:EmrB/QacA subfamily drug resistance transporter
VDRDTVHARRWWALAVMCCSLAIISIDNTVLNLAIPSLVRDLHASTSQLQYIIDGYTLVFAGLLLTTGSLGDRFGRRRFMAIGLGIFCVGSALSALATEPWHLIATRAVMGLGGAFIMPATLSLLTNIFDDPKERARAIGWWAAVAGGGAAVGPIVAGLLLDRYGWGSVFLINVPVTIGALIAGQFVLPEFKDDHAPALDPLGAVLSIVGLVGVLWAIIEAPSKGWGAVTPVLLGGLVVLALFVVWELVSAHPMLELRFFRNRRFSAANATLTIVFFGTFGVTFLISQYLQTVLGYSPLAAGMRMIPMPVVMLVFSTQAPRLAERFGSKLVVTAGLLLMTLGLVVASFVPVHHGYMHLVVSQCIIALGWSFTMAPATEAVMGSLPPSKAGVGSAMNDTTRYVGGSLGVAVIGSIFASFYRPAITDRLAPFRLPASAVAAARESVGGAMAVANRVGGSAGNAIAELARHEFVDAMAPAMRFGAVTLLGAAILVFVYLPARAGDPREGQEGALDGIASATFAEAEGVLQADAAAEVGVEQVS